MQIEKNMDCQARTRLSYLFDDGKYTEINSYAKENDCLTGVVTAYGYVNGNAVYAFSQDKSINNGAVGPAHAAKIAKLYSLAAKTGTPVIGIHDSNGAFVNGTAESLTAYGELINAASVISGVVPQISVVAGTCAGSAALFACSSDFIIMTKDAEFFMTPAFTKENSGSASDAAANGIAAAVCDDDKAAIEKAKELINLMPVNNLAPLPMFEYNEPETAVSADFNSLINGVCDAESIIELYAEFGKASYTALATVNGATVGIAATNKTSDKLTDADCSKLSRFIRTCDAFAVPVITFVDTEGFDAADAISGVKSMTQLANCYAEATTAKISVITGKAVGPAFIALAGKDISSDFTYIWESACVSPLAPLSAVEFLWHDKLKGAADVNAKRNELAEEYKATLASAESAAASGAVDEIISASSTREAIISALDILSSKRVTKLPKKHNNIPF
ncbi:MAG: carboxyl transferase [Ruminococcus sp.]|nr:carboxyl transferase [Ruminococcus sp.]MDD6635591.1 carboxyl transferase domain-containing protein [Ruminococcus sp.]MDY3844138.1 carboxyl transferase domain-containing protein [Ruminococcus sp.]CDF01133.1 acetyl-CoA carboxylase carboxyltransferase component (Subunits alpha and beta) [Ruminococcus sp. CAG:624]